MKKSGIAMEIGEFNEEYNHTYSEEERYVAPYRKDHFAYTGKDGKIYAIYLPDDNENILPKDAVLYCSERIGKITFKGNDLPYMQNDCEIFVSLPREYQKEPAYVLTITIGS